MNVVGYGIASSIYSAIQNAKTKKDIKKLYKSVDDANYKSRSVAVMPYVNKEMLLLKSHDDNDVYTYSTDSKEAALDYIWGESTVAESLVVTGGEEDERARALATFIRKSQVGGTSVIVISAGNPFMEKAVAENSSFYESSSGSSLYYDLFRGMTVEDISSVLYETMPNKTTAKAESLFRAVVDIVIRMFGNADLSRLASYSIASLMDDLDELRTRGAVSEEEYKSISRDFMSGSSEIDEVRSFLYKMNRQMESVFGMPGRSSVNFKKTMNISGVVFIDIGKSSNDMVLDLILNHLLLYQERGRQFNMVLEGVNTGRFEQIRTLARGRAIAYGSKDFFASLFGGDIKGDDLFSELMGNVTTTVVFNHPSGTSCKKWSEHIGYYHKFKIKFSISQSQAFIVGGNKTQGIQVEEADEPRVRAETIALLPRTFACITNKKGTLIADV